MPLSDFKRPLAGVLLAYIAALCLAHAFGWRRAQPQEEWLRLAAQPCVRVVGTVASGFTENRIGERLLVRATSARRCGLGEEATDEPLPETGVMTTLPAHSSVTAALRPGYLVAMEGWLRPAAWPRMPGDFDEAAFLAERGARFVLTAERIVLLSSTPGARWLPEAAAEWAHRSIHASFRETLRPESAMVMEGLLLGYKGTLRPETNQAIQDAGVMHLLVPSGAKVVVIMGIGYGLAAWLGAGLWTRFVCVAMIGGFYVLVVGAGAPYLRAYYGAVAAGVAHALGREAAGFQSLVLSALAILIWRPDDLFGAGFQMTYAAVLGLLIAMPRWTPPKSWPRSLRFAARVVSASAVVQLMLAPIMAGIFGRVSLIGLLANMPLIPASAAYVAAGLALWGAWLIGSPALVAAIAIVIERMVDVFLWMCGHFAALPMAAFDAGGMGQITTLAYYLVAFALLVLPQWRLAAVSLSLAVLVWCGAWAHRRILAPRAQVVFLAGRVWFGDAGWRALVVRTQEGYGYWIGSGALPVRSAKRALEGLGMAKVDAAFLEDGQVVAWRSPELVPRAAELVPVARRGAVAREGIRVESTGSRLSIDVADLRIEADAMLRESVVRARRTGKGEGDIEYCILHLPRKSVPEPCSPERAFDTAKDGAVWIESDGRRHSVTTQRQIHSVGGLVP